MIAIQQRVQAPQRARTPTIRKHRDPRV